MKKIFLCLLCLCCGNVLAQEQSTVTLISQEESIAKLARPGSYREGAAELKQGGAGVMADLFKVAKNKSTSKEQRVGAILMLGEIAGENTISQKKDGTYSNIAAFFEKTLTSDSDESMRQAAAIGIANMGNRNSIPKLKKALEDKSPKVRARAAWALAKLGDKTGRTVALKTVDEKSPGAQAVAVEALEELGDKTLIPELEDKYKNAAKSNKITARLAIKAIEAKNLDGESKVNYYAEAMKDEQTEISNWASRKLAEEVDNNGVNKIYAAKALEHSAKNNNSSANNAVNYLRAHGKLEKSK